MFYMGDWTTSDTIYFPFATYDSNGASVTITGLAATDIEIYKDGSVTQRSSDSGFALLDTDGIDFDSTTGIHGFSVDLSDNTDAGFYAAGSQYWVVVNAITVDSQTVRLVYYFTIGMLLKPTTAGNTLDVTSTGGAGLDWGNVENAGTTVDLSATSINLCDTITTYTGNTVQTGDAFARLGAPAGASVSADIADVPTVAEFNARTLVAASYFDPAADTVANVTTVATLTGHTAQTGDSFARLGAPAGVSVSADIAAAQTDLDTITDTGVTCVAVTSAGITDIWSTDTLTEAYATDGSAATAAQLLYMIWSALAEFAISSTTITAKKLDGSTTAMTFTLDDATTPTSRTRAT